MSLKHPDQLLVEYILHGLSEGFDIGFVGENYITRPKNLLSANANKAKVSEAINNELTRGHTAGPFVFPPFPDLHCSPIGAVPKPDGSVRLIMDLSQPRGQSVNEHIDKDEFSVQYTHFDRATDLVLAAGRNCLMSKVDIKHAFRLMPVKPSNWKLLGFFWEGYFFIDVRLSFGLRSSPGIFGRFADLICWVLKTVFGLDALIHYSDDFFLVSCIYEGVARADLQRMIEAFIQLNIPLAPEKILGPATILIYLGILIDSGNMTIAVPRDKYLELMVEIPRWLARRKCIKQELLSLIGKLSFICKVVRPGRIFLRRLIDLSMTARELHHHISINSEAQEDIKWWWEFLPTWKQSSLIPQSLQILSTDLKVFTDASLAGFGAIRDKSWLQHRWVGQEVGLSIDFYELFAILAAVYVWGQEWEGKRVVIVTDNLPVTQIWQSGTTKAKNMMFLIRKLFLIAAKKGFSLSMKHIPGESNCIADALSRFQVARFRQLVPDADVRHTELTPEVTRILATATIIR